MEALCRQLAEALKAAEQHLEYCGYGDSWERECAKADNLEGKITDALEAAEKAGILDA